MRMSLASAASRTLVAAGVLAGFASAASAAISFTDVSTSAGVDDSFSSSTNHVLGIAWVDVNNDGREDLFAVNGIADGSGNDEHLYINNGDGSFTTRDDLIGVLPDVEMAGVNFADYDNDGDKDLFITVNNEQWSLWDFQEPDGPANMLLQNQFVENGNQIIEGDPLFVDVAATAGVDGVLGAPLGDYPAMRSMTAAFLDYDTDGCVDLFVGQLVLQAAGETQNRNTLYRNRCNGTGTFANVSRSAGIDSDTEMEMRRPTLASLGTDLNRDGQPDIYAVNVHEPDAPFHYDFAFINNGDLTFSNLWDVSPGMGDDSGSGMGIDMADIDLDGDWDIYISDVFLTQNDEEPLGNVLYLGNGDGTWSDNSAVTAGVEADFSWGVTFVDVDHDGYEDLYVAAAGQDFLYHNNADGTFSNVIQAAGIDMPGNGRGSAIADYDKDGDVDIAVVDEAGTLHLLRNDSTNIGNWLQVELEGTTSNRSAINAVVKVSAGGLNMMREVKGGSSSHSQSSLIQAFGVGSAQIVDEIRVQWPGGAEGIYANVVANSRIALIEGVGAADSDGDGFVDTQDNCPNVANADQADADGNGVGDACEAATEPDPLSVTEVDPSTVSQGTSVDLTLTGTGFVPETQVGLSGGSRNGGSVEQVVYVDENTLIVTINVTASARLGGRQIVARNPDGQEFRLRRAFRVVEP